MKKNLLVFIFASVLLLSVGCGKKKLTNETTRIENQLIELSSLKYERKGECGNAPSHKVVHVGGIISTPDGENFFVTDFQLALYLDERRFDFYEARHSGAGNDTSFLYEDRDSGILEIFDGHIKLVGLGDLKLEFDGEKIRPTLVLNAHRVPEVPRRDYLARVVHTSSTKIYPGCGP